MDHRDKDSSSKIDHVLAEVLAKQERGERIDLQGLLAEHKDIAESLRSYFENSQLFSAMLRAQEPNGTDTSGEVADRATEIEVGHPQSEWTRTDGFQADLREVANESEQMPIGAVRFGSMFGRYRIECLLGDGGMGAVYLAHDTLLNRPVALKTPKFSGQNAARLVKRFRREAQAAAKLHHRNICPVHDVGRCEGMDYLTMAYIEGKPLSAYISSRRPLGQQQVALIIRRLALGLQAAHEAGVVHRDLKPSKYRFCGDSKLHQRRPFDRVALCKGRLRDPSLDEPRRG